MEYPKIYAVDFDGTLAIGAKWPQIGEANEELFQFLIKRREAGDKVILWTCREGEMLEAAVKFCNSHGLCFDAINDNVKENKVRTEWTLACLKINPESRNKTNRLHWKEQKQ